MLPMNLPAAEAVDPGTERIIVKWRSTHDAPLLRQQRMRELAQRLGNPFARGRNLGGNLSVLHLATRQRGRQLEDTLAALRADPTVELAQVDERMRTLAYTPSDELFSFDFTYRGTLLDYQWYLKGTQAAAIRADAAWDITHGGDSAATSPVVIAVLDTGIRPDHPDLAGKLLPGFDFISTPEVSNDLDGWDPDPTDTGDFITAQDLQTREFHGCGNGENFDQPTMSGWHGTRVAGLIGASTDNGIGMAGAAFNVRIVPVRVLGKCGGFLSDVLAGMYWAAGFFDDDSGHPIPAPVLADPGALRSHPNLHPAQVINMSLGAPGACSEMYQIAVRDITASGVLIVAAAGNDGGGVDKPANCSGVLAVAGLRHAGTKVGYSNLGSEVGIAAPAGNCFPRSHAAGPESSLRVCAEHPDQSRHAGADCGGLLHAIRAAILRHQLLRTAGRGHRRIDEGGQSGADAGAADRAHQGQCAPLPHRQRHHAAAAGLRVATAGHGPEHRMHLHHHGVWRRHARCRQCRAAGTAARRTGTRHALRQHGNAGRQRQRRRPRG